METIEKVVYINLEYRTDRRQHIQQELSIFPAEKIIHFNAIKHNKGGIGCSMSHIGVLELAIKNNWKNVLIVEDDLQWKNFDNGHSILSNLVKNPYDVIMLSGHSVKYNRKTYKLQNCCARTAYLVSNHYYQTLLNNYKTGLVLLEKDFRGSHRGDMYWNRLQERDKWYIIMPQMCMQQPSFSDIEKRHVDYTYFINPKRIVVRNVRFNPK